MCVCVSVRMFCVNIINIISRKHLDNSFGFATCSLHSGLTQLLQYFHCCCCCYYSFCVFFFDFLVSFSWSPLYHLSHFCMALTSHAHTNARPMALALTLTLSLAVECQPAFWLQLLSRSPTYAPPLSTTLSLPLSLAPSLILSIARCLALWLCFRPVTIFS